MKILAPILIFVVVFTGCNPVKKVLKNKDQFEKIGLVWAQEHPCANDSINIFLPGDTITQVTTHTDTLYNYTNTETTVNGDTVFIDRIITKMKTINNLLHDTLKITVADKRLTDALNKQLVTENITALENKGRAGKRLWMFIASTIFNILLLVFILKKK